mgnify:CR=1 FL=1
MNEIQEGRLKGLRVGDKCFTRFGYGVVAEINYSKDASLVLKIECRGNSIFYFFADGRYEPNDFLPSVWFDKPEIIEPPRPKRKVTKTIERWVSIFTNGYESPAYNAKEYAEQSNPQSDLLATIKLTGTYEVEE